MSVKARLWISGAIFLTGFAALVLFNWYLKPVWQSEPAVRMISFVPKNEIITEQHVVLARVSKDALPERVIRDLREVIGKKANADLPAGLVLAPELVDVDNLNPGPGEAIFPLPKEVLFAVNSSLRAKDKVHIYLYRDVQSRPDEMPRKAAGEPFLRDVRVVAARNDSGNMVMDSEKGNINDRITSTDRIGHVELLLKEEEVSLLREKIEQGFKLWLVRVP